MKSASSVKATVLELMPTEAEVAGLRSQIVHLKAELAGQQQVGGWMVWRQCIGGGFGSGGSLSLRLRGVSTSKLSWQGSSRSE